MLFKSDLLCREFICNSHSYLLFTADNNSIYTHCIAFTAEKSLGKLVDSNQKLNHTAHAFTGDKLLLYTLYGSLDVLGHRYQA